jgi:predicted SAM-dependent methyltransferase
MRPYLEIGPFQGRISDEWDIMDAVAKASVDIVATLGIDLLDIPDNRYEIVYASHVFEHVPWQRIDVAFRECHRILKPDGDLEVWVPDFAKIVEAYQRWESVEDGWHRRNPDQNVMTWINGRLFYGDRGEGSLHRACFDETHLRYHFGKAGFRDITRLESPRSTDHGWINLGVRGTK